MLNKLSWFIIAIIFAGALGISTYYYIQYQKVATDTSGKLGEASVEAGIDYNNGQEASATLKGFLTSTDWAKFNNKQDALIFNANDFIVSNNNVSIDYSNSQKASAYSKGFLTANDWINFNSKITGSGLSNTTPGLTYSSATGTTSLTVGYVIPTTVQKNNWNAAATANHAVLTIGTANGLSLSTQQLSLGLASNGATGALSGTNWNTFNGKQDALTSGSNLAVGTLVLGTPLSILSGGTGAATATGATDNLEFLQAGTGATSRSLTDKLKDTVSVKDFGANGNGVTFLDGTISASSASFTSATSTFTSGDVGKLIIVYGAGSSGGLLATTIASYVSAHTVILTASASTSVSNAKGAYGTDNATAISNAIASIATSGGTVQFPAGIYVTCQQTLIQNSFVFLQGLDQGATILYAGSGSIDGAVKFAPTSPDVNCAGAGAGCVFDGGILNMMVRGDSNATNALLIVASHHMTFRQVHLADATNCFTSQFAVLNTYDQMICSDNESQSDATKGFLFKPTNGFVLGAMAGVPSGQSMSGTWTNTIAERVSGIGINLASAGNNTFISGTSEGNGTGVAIQTQANRNVFIATDFEANSTADVLVVGGSYNAFHTILSSSLVRIQTAGGTIIDGGQFVNITIDSGAGDTRLSNVAYTGTLTNSSTSTHMVSVCKGLCNGGLSDNQTNLLITSRVVQSVGAVNTVDFGANSPYLMSLFSSNAQAANMGGGLLFGGTYTGTSQTAFAGIFGKKLNGNAGDYSGYLSFNTRDNGNLPAEAMRIDNKGNVGIGTTLPNANAILDVSSTTKAFMPPRMTTAQRDAVASPTAGMMIYNTSTNKLNIYTTAWEAVTSAP